eukprot:gene10974-11055_t
MLVLIVGPSGAGKDTLLDAVRAKLAGRGDIRFARREITRAATPGGEDHLPVEIETFASRCRAGGYALWWEAHGLGYGIGADIIDDLNSGHTVVASVSRAIIPNAASRFDVRVVEVTAPPEVLAQRLASRGRESAEDIARRLERQVKLPEGIDCVTVMNDDTIAAGAAKLLRAIEDKMYYARYYTLTQSEVRDSSDEDFPCQYLRKSGRMSRIITNEPNETEMLVVKPGDNELNLDNKGFMFCSTSKSDIKSALNSSRVNTFFKTSGAQISLLAYSYDAIISKLRIANKKRFNLSGYAVIIARADWFDPLARNQTKLLGDTTVSGKTIVNFVL